IANHIIAWIIEDNYVETRTMDRWTSTKKQGEWVETPPDYMSGTEPNWSKLKPLVIDRASIYAAAPPPSYNPLKNSDFYKMVNAVYQQSKELDEKKREVAMFWDDNPNTSEYHGHLVTITHKISPPGHWLNIISQVSKKDNSDLFKTTKAYTYTAIAMYDAIISCWYEKYKTNLVRPITYIQENIDINWKPLIQTPPFPEYTSGHSAISAAAATILASIYGDNYAFTDSTEVLFGQPVRSFPSFQEAAWEVSLSRFYAGIHYMNGVSEGNKQGIFIGQIILDKLK
ncbi:MAG: vanadium-dependent haloperoxidase, partial [Saprospiraceae bacterium]